VTAVATETNIHNQIDTFRMGEFPVAGIVRAATLAIVAACTWFNLMPQFRGIDLLAIAAILFCGFDVFKEAIENVFDRRMTMELSMTLAIAAAAAIGEYFTAEIILEFVIVAEMLEEMTVERGRKAVYSLADLLPSTALVVRDGATVEVSVNELAAGDIVLAKPGALIPADGTVIRGHSFIEQTTITGEPLASEKVEGSRVFAGTVNGQGVLEVRCEALGRESIYGKILTTIEEAEGNRAPIERTADRLAGYLVYFALACALATFATTRNVRSTISVIIVAGACGVAAGTPLAILGALARCARRGAIVKGGQYIELLSEIDTVVLDKTGTLTFGDPTVVGVEPAPGMNAETVLSTAAAVERFSDHPLSRAILNHTAGSDRSVAHPDGFEYVPGKGIRARLLGEQVLVGSRDLLVDHNVRVDLAFEDDRSQSAVLVALGGIYLGTIRIEDQLRPESIGAVRDLKKMGLRVVLLTGDSRSAASAVASLLGVDELKWGLLPHEKVTAIDRLRSEGRIVATVGDGINDAPALARSTVGVAMGSGADITRQTANVLLVGNDVSAFVDVLKTTRRCRRIIMTNFAGTLAVDLAGIGLAAYGLLNPLLAAFIHVASELSFIGNSARLIPARSRMPLHDNQRTGLPESASDRAQRSQA
jgi:heavy metal translocating P-type ATPase